MKRSAMPRRTTPLRTRAPIVRGTSKLQRTPMKKRRARVKDTIVGDLRALAKGRVCQIRIPCVCLGPQADTVLAHYRLHTGAGKKPPDTNGAHSCTACHDEADRRTRRTSFIEARLCHAEGCLRTLELLAKEGYELRRLP